MPTPEEIAAQEQKVAAEKQAADQAAAARLELHKKIDGYKFKLPEGVQALDEAKAKEYREYAKKHGLSEEVMQSVYEREHQAVRSFDESENQRFTDVKNTWKKNLLENPKYKGEGKLEEAAQRIKAGLAKKTMAYEGMTLADMLDKTGFGDHPAVFEFLDEVFKAAAEDGGAPLGVKPGPKPATPAQEHAGSVGLKK